MIDLTKYDKVFYTPLIRFQAPEHETFNTALLVEAARLREEDEGVSKSNKGGWHSKGNFFHNDAAPIKVLRAFAKEAVIKATGKIAPKFDPEGFNLKLFGWMNANPPGGFNAPHTHPGAHWSGVYYVSQPEVEEGSSGKIEFLDPRSDLPNWRMFGAAAFRSKKQLRPAVGEMVLFPSYLSHWVYPNETDEERITVAFNATFSKKSKHSDT